MSSIPRLSKDMVVKKIKKICNKKEIVFIEKYYRYVVLLLFLFVVLSALYKLGTVPRGINIDEAGTYYDALLLAKNGTDRYLNKYPIYLINYGGGQSAMYSYLTALLIKIFGDHLILVRIPAVFFRIISFLFAIYLVKPMKNKTSKFLMLLLLTITPYFIMQCRFGLDCNLMISFSIISLSFFVNYFYDSKLKLLLLSGLFFGISLYTYALSFIILPLFFLIIVIYLLIIKRIKFKEIIIFGCPFLILAIPLFLFILVNYNIIPEIKSFITIPKLPHFRNTEISPINIFLSNLIILSIFSFDGLIKGDLLVYNAVPEFGTLYYISIPFAILGFFESIKEFSKDKKDNIININTIMVVWFVSVLICMLIIYYPNINKANAIFISLIYFIYKGIICVTKNNKKILLFIVAIYLLNYGFFLNFYFNKYNIKYDSPITFETYSLDALDYSTKLDGKTVYINPNDINPIYIYIKNPQIKYEINPYEIITDNKKYVFAKINDESEDCIYITKDSKTTWNAKSKKFGNVYVLYN